MTEWLGLPPLASAHGGQIDGLIAWIHVFMLILFVGWGGFLAIALIRFRRSRNPVANYTGVKSHVSTYSEIAVAVIEAILLFAFSVPIWAARVDRIPPESEALVVRVTGEQFAWNVHYAGPDGVFGRTDIKLLDLQANPLGLDRSDPAAKDDVTTLNQLYLPVNKPIIVRLRSKDVIHSFGVPEFRVKQDAVPGLTIPIWFIPNVSTAEMRTRTGNPVFQYEIACAQLCGLGHARMRGFVTVQSAEEFQKWLEDQLAQQAEATADPFR
jgi:cytochrome c oxidase subunit 2